MPDRHMPDRRPNNLRLAWVAVAVIPVAFVLAMAVGEGLQSLSGHADGDVPTGTALLIGLPVTAVAMIPALLAVLFGRRASREGHRSGRYAVIIGVAVIAYWLLTLIAGALDLT